MTGADAKQLQEGWKKLLDVLDDRLQFGLLEHLRRSPHQEIRGETLHISAGSADDHRYLTKDTVFQQLAVFVRDCVAVEQIVIEPPL